MMKYIEIKFTSTSIIEMKSIRHFVIRYRLGTAIVLAAQQSIKFFFKHKQLDVIFKF